MKELKALREKFNIAVDPNSLVIALAGNPNTGKSTIFNALTGLRQHTGNWPGKTVVQAQGEFQHNKRNYLLVDLPGTYSLFPNSPDERVARDFLCFARPDATIAVADATCLERNLNLILQIIEITPRVVVCLNLMDEAERKNIKIDVKSLADKLGVPVIPTIARNGQGLRELKYTLNDLITEKIEPSPFLIDYGEDIEGRIKQVEQQLKLSGICKLINSRWLALRILDKDQSLDEGLKYYFNLDSEVYSYQ